MPNLVQTPASVVTNGTNSQLPGTSGSPINAGNPIYQDANGNWNAAGASGQLLSGGNTLIRIALNSAPGAGQPITTMVSGKVNLGATLQQGQVYVVSNTTGAICPYSDLVNTNWVTLLGVALDQNNLQCNPFAYNTQHS